MESLDSQPRGGDEQEQSESVGNLDPKTDLNDVDIEALLDRPRIFGPRRRRTVYGAPEFVKRLNAFEEAEAGGTVVFSCQVKGLPKPAIKWYRDEDEISDNDQRYYVTSADAGVLLLTVTDLQKGDEGAYKCKAENQEGVASTTGYLSVTGDVTDKPLSVQQARTQPHPERAVSSAPHLRTIPEQWSVEEREAEEYDNLSRSPIQDYIDEFRRGHHTWPFFTDSLHPDAVTPHTDGDLGLLEIASSGSDTSVESQDYDRVSIDFDVEDDQVELRVTEDGDDEGAAVPSEIDTAAVSAGSDVIHLNGSDLGATGGVGVNFSHTSNDDVEESAFDEFRSEFLAGHDTCQNTARNETTQRAIHNTTPVLSDEKEQLTNGHMTIDHSPEIEQNILSGYVNETKLTSFPQLTPFGDSREAETVSFEPPRSETLRTVEFPETKNVPESLSESIGPRISPDLYPYTTMEYADDEASQLPWLFYLLLVSLSTFIGSVAEVSPLLFIILIAIISLISFRVARRKTST